MNQKSNMYVDGESDGRTSTDEVPAFQPYWGKPAVRNDRGDGGNVAIIRSPLRATVLPDCGGREVNSRPYSDRGRGEQATAPPMPIGRDLVVASRVESITLGYQFS